MSLSISKHFRTTKILLVVLAFALLGTLAKNALSVHYGGGGGTGLIAEWVDRARL